MQYLHYISLVYVRIPLIYSNMLPYTLKSSWNLSIPHLFVLSLHYFSKLSWRLIILTPKIPWDQKLVDCCLGSLCEDFFIFFQFFYFFSIFSFKQVNYIFHKLSVNTKHIQFRLYMSPWRTFVENKY
jgi:hypothetical protein